MFSICETKGESHMVKVNLHAFYPFYDQDCLIGVSDEVAAALQFFERQEASYQRRIIRWIARMVLKRTPLFCLYPRRRFMSRRQQENDCTRQ